MTTPAERQALAFLAGLTLLGTGVRVVRALGSAPEPDPAAEAALERQIVAVDSARAAQERGRGVARARRGERGARRGRSARSAAAAAPTTQSEPVVTLRDPVTKVDKVDVDVASAAEIEPLPRIGPALARRIVADRDSLGPFGSLNGLERVKGVGPALAKTLAPHVTFSGTPRPSHVNAPDRDAPGGTRRRSRPRPP